MHIHTYKSIYAHTHAYTAVTDLEREELFNDLWLRSSGIIVFVEPGTMDGYVSLYVCKHACMWVCMYVCAVHYGWVRFSVCMYTFLCICSTIYGFAAAELSCLLNQV